MSSPECNPDDIFYFNILSDSGEELFTGENPKYNIGQLRLYNDRNGRVYVDDLYKDVEGLQAYIDHRFDRLIVEIHGQSKDTLELKLTVTENKCCGKETQIDKVIINSQEIDYYHQDDIDIIVMD